MLTLFPPSAETGHRQCVREPVAPGPGQVGITLAIEQVPFILCSNTNLILNYFEGMMIINEILKFEIPANESLAATCALISDSEHLNR